MNKLNKLILAATLIIPTVAISYTNNSCNETERHLQEVKSDVKSVISDSVITVKVKELLLSDPDVSGFKIHVTTKEGIVKLKGKVNTNAEKCIAINLTKRVEGVQDINFSKLKVVEE